MSWYVFASLENITYVVKRVNNIETIVNEATLARLIINRSRIFKPVSLSCINIRLKFLQSQVFMIDNFVSV